MDAAPFQPWTAGAAGSGAGSGPEEEPPVKRERSEGEDVGTEAMPAMDATRLSSLRLVVENTVGGESRQRVARLLEQVEVLNGAERLLLYLRLPAGAPPPDPLKQPLNALGSRSEIQHTVTWIQTHLEVDAEVSLPKQDVYDEYIAFCMSSSMKPLSTADFGKVMKQVYPCVRPRRLGTRGNSRYCYAGLRKKIKLEVPQLPDLAEMRQRSDGAGGDAGRARAQEEQGAARLVCEWAEGILGVKVSSLPELAAHLLQHAPLASPLASSLASPLASPLASSLASPLASPSRYQPAGPEGSQPAAAGVGVGGGGGGGGGTPRHPRQLLGQLKRKIQLQPASLLKKSKRQDSVDLPALSSTLPIKQTISLIDEEEKCAGYSGYPAGFLPGYEPRASYAAYSHAHAPGRAHPASHQHAAPPPPPARDYRDPFPAQAPYNLSVVRDAAYCSHNVPINLSSDALRPHDLSSPPARREWPHERPPDPPPQPPAPTPLPPPPPPPPSRLPLPGKKMILEAYQHETQTASSLHSTNHPSVHHHTDNTHLYLPKKMRAAESLGGKLAASRHATFHVEPPLLLRSASNTTPAAPTPDESLLHYQNTFLEGPKNLPCRSKSIAAALVRMEVDVESPTPGGAIPTSRPTARGRPRKRSPGNGGGRGRGGSGRGRRRRASPERLSSPPGGDSCCGLDGINLKTGIICKERHSEILNRERVISICSMDKHALDDYLNEGSSQEHEEELMQYFHRSTSTPPPPGAPDAAAPALTEEHRQGNSDKISQLRELLVKNLKNQSGVSSHVDTALHSNEGSQVVSASDGTFKSIAGPNITCVTDCNLDGSNYSADPRRSPSRPVPELQQHGPSVATEPPDLGRMSGEEVAGAGSPASRMQQYDFVPISPGHRSPENADLTRCQSHTRFDEALSPIKSRLYNAVDGQPVGSPRDHRSRSTQASSFVSPRNTPVPRSRLCPKPLPDKLMLRKRNMFAINTGPDSCHRQIGFAVPNEQKCMLKSPVYSSRAKYLPMSAPPSPNILSSRYKSPFQQGTCSVPNGNICANLSFSHGPGVGVMGPYGDNANGDGAPLSADPLSSEVSQFFHDESLTYDGYQQEGVFRSQSVPLNRAEGGASQAYNTTPANSVPPTPVPHEFCDFGSLTETCESISKAGLNSESLDKIYNVLDSTAGELQLQLPPPQRNGHHDPPDPLVGIGTPDHDRAYQQVNELLKRSNSMEFVLSELVMEKSRFFPSRSVPSTPLPYHRAAHPAGAGARIDRLERHALYAPASVSQIMSSVSKSVPSTPLLSEERSVFSYTNHRDFLINGNSLESTVASAGPTAGGFEPRKAEAAGPLPAGVLEESPLQDIMDLQSLPTADLLADLHQPYPDL